MFPDFIHTQKRDPRTNDRHTQPSVVSDSAWSVWPRLGPTMWVSQSTVVHTSRSPHPVREGADTKASFG